MEYIMYKQENKAGFKEFLIVILMAVISVILTSIAGWFIGALTGFPWAGDILLIAMCVIMVFLVYNHYASVYTYRITQKHIVIEKKAGRKITEYDIPIVEINKMYIRKKLPKLKGKKLRLCSSMFGYKKTTVIICGQDDQIVVFEPNDKFIAKIKEYIND